MTDNRFWIIGIGAALMSALALLLMFAVQDQLVRPEAWPFAAALVFAPVYLIGMWAIESSSSIFAIAPWLLVTSLVAMGGVVSHPIVPRRGTAALAVIGFIAWTLCMLMVAGSVV
jgi:hypothetical protein